MFYLHKINLYFIVGFNHKICIFVIVNHCRCNFFQCKTPAYVEIEDNKAAKEVIGILNKPRRDFGLKIVKKQKLMSKNMENLK